MHGEHFGRLLCQPSRLAAAYTRSCITRRHRDYSEFTFSAFPHESLYQLRHNSQSNHMTTIIILLHSNTFLSLLEWIVDMQFQLASKTLTAQVHSQNDSCRRSTPSTKALVDQSQELSRTLFYLCQFQPFLHSVQWFAGPVQSKLSNVEVNVLNRHFHRMRRRTHIHLN